jgi:hypothetical protein
MTEEYITDALEMMGIVEPKQIVTEISGFVPVFDVVIHNVKDHITALVFGRIWQYCGMSDGVCRATIERLADDLEVSSATIMRHIEILEKFGYIFDRTPERRNRPHEYADCGRVVMKGSLSAIAQKNVRPSQSNVAIAESQLIKQDNTKLNKNDLTEKEKDQVNAKVDAILGGSIGKKLAAEKQAIDAFESAFGIIRPWNWYPAKTTDERTWRDFRGFIVELHAADCDCFSKYVTWTRVPYAKGTMSSLGIKRNPQDFPDSWNCYLASSSMYANQNEEHRL